MNMHIEWTQNQARINELKAENAQLLEVINAHNKKMSEGVYTTNEQCAKEVAEHDRLLAENAAQAKRIADLEFKWVLANGHTIEEMAKEIESLRKQVEEVTAAAKNTLYWVESSHRPPVPEFIPCGTMVYVRLHALAGLHKAVYGEYAQKGTES